MLANIKYIAEVTPYYRLKQKIFWVADKSEHIHVVVGRTQGGPDSKLLHFVHIFAKYRLIFSIFLPVDTVRNLLPSGVHTTLIMSLHYFVKYKYLKTYNSCRWTELYNLNVKIW